MLVRGRRLVVLIGPVLLLFTFCLYLFDRGGFRSPFHAGKTSSGGGDDIYGGHGGKAWLGESFSTSEPSQLNSESDSEHENEPQFGSASSSQDGLVSIAPLSSSEDDNEDTSRSSENNDMGAITSPDSLSQADIPQSTHCEVFSVSTPNARYFTIDFGSPYKTINPNIIPHPSLNDTWIVVAQRMSTRPNSVFNVELVCDAVFVEEEEKKDTILRCIDPPVILPIAATNSPSETERCLGDLAALTLNIGPHDARVFFGPNAPYTIYGSNSQYTCFGQWMQDLRLLVDWGFDLNPYKEFRIGTELQRPKAGSDAGAYRAVEKNWFVFWDDQNKLYLHYDISPRRAFAKLEPDGSVGLDIAPLAAWNDEACMAKYMPPIAPDGQQSIHQSTNSLTITLCKRSDLSCNPDDSNTFILTIFHHKSFYSFHSVYEPYVMLFRRAAPFDIYGISTKPIWIHGRGGPGQGKRPQMMEAGWDQTEMFYVTSISWKSRELKYHGYSDDVLFLAFGIEDERTGGIDILAGDLLNDLGLCSM
ncbi:hypothetical protein Plec18167_008560 [Paecilomyces lecythidis]|uniref:Uncharacterized protein n=1 Tax=Paecilomyces lecythidis TaxID=3004212 RepID=A0ABR3WWW2_9EURO